MIRKRRVFNPGRTIAEKADDVFNLSSLIDVLRYGGNPEHKMNPGDFGLSPPSSPRQGKTLCDKASVFTRNEALELLREGVRCGLVSMQARNGFPQNRWTVAANGVPVEAQLENAVLGVYHAYPLQDIDPMYAEILNIWKNKHEWNI